MSDVKNESRVSDLRVVCYGEASIKKILPKSGVNAGKEITVLSMRAYHPKSVRKPDGTFDLQETEWYTLQLFDDKAALIKSFLKDGLVLRVSGEVKTRKYQDKNGKEQIASDLTLYSIAVDLKQRGLLSIGFEKPLKKDA